MSTAARDIRVSVVAETQAYQREIAKTGAYTAKQLNTATRQFAAETLKASARVTAEHKKGAQEAARAWSDVGATIKGALGFQALKAAATGAYQYVDAIHAATAETAAFSEATGIHRETLGALEAAAGRAGLSIDEIRGGMEDFGERMFDFSMGAGEAKEAFQLLGVEVTDGAGKLRKTDDVLREVLTRMPRLRNEAERNAVAQQLFSDAGNRLNAALRAAPLEDWIRYARESGRVVSDDAVAATKAWTAATDELAGVWSRAMRDMSAEFDAAGKIEDFTLGLTFAIYAAAEGFAVASERVGKFSKMLGQLASGDLFGANDTWLTGLQTIDDDLARILTAGLQAAHGLHSARTEVDGLAQAADQAGGKIAKTGGSTRALGAQGMQLADAMRELQGIVVDSSADVLTAEQKLGIAYEGRLDKIEQIRKATLKAALTSEQASTLELGAQEAATAALGEYQRALAALTEQMEQEDGPKLSKFWQWAKDNADKYLIVIQQAAEAMQVFTGIVIDHHARAAAAARDSINERARMEADLEARIAAGMTDQERRYADLQLARLESLNAAAEQELDTHRRAALRAFRINQALQQAMVLANSAGALMATFAYTGFPPAPGGYAAIATAGVMTAAQSAAIWATPPPQFDAGFPGFTMGPTNYPAILDEGEGVANRRAMSALGGPEAMDELNRTGRLPAQGMQAVELALDGRVIGRWIADEAGRGRELSRALHPQGYRPGVAPPRRG